MSVTLKPEMQSYVETLVRSGKFASEQEVVEAAIARLMLDPMDVELDSDDIAAISESEEQIARGEHVELRQAADQLQKELFKD